MLLRNDFLPPSFFVSLSLSTPIAEELPARALPEPETKYARVRPMRVQCPFAGIGIGIESAKSEDPMRRKETVLRAARLVRLVIRNGCGREANGFSQWTV